MTGLASSNLTTVELEVDQQHVRYAGNSRELRPSDVPRQASLLMRPWRRASFTSAVTSGTPSLAISRLR